MLDDSADTIILIRELATRVYMYVYIESVS